MSIPALWQEDLFAIVGVSQHADEKHIIRAWKETSRKLHPDKNLEHKEKATEQIKLLNAAKEVLVDKQERERYLNYRNTKNRFRNYKGNRDHHSLVEYDQPSRSNEAWANDESKFIIVMLLALLIVILIIFMVGFLSLYCWLTSRCLGF